VNRGIEVVAGKTKWCEEKTTPVAMKERAAVKVLSPGFEGRDYVRAVNFEWKKRIAGKAGGDETTTDRKDDGLATGESYQGKRRKRLFKAIISSWA